MAVTPVRTVRIGTLWDDAVELGGLLGLDPKGTMTVALEVLTSMPLDQLRQHVRDRAAEQSRALPVQEPPRSPTS